MVNTTTRPEIKPINTIPVKGRYCVETWGCQMNVLDSQKMAGSLEHMGYLPTDQPEKADIVLLNTCSIREKAAQKLFTRLGQLRKMKQERGILLCVMGCVAQQEGEAILKRAPYVDLVAGPRALVNLPYLVEEASRQVMVDTEYYDSAVLYDKELISRPSNGKAFITIMEGCDKHCAYCIVPVTRGAEICRPMDHILDEVKALLDSGVTEIEVLGQNVNSYRDGKTKFVDVLDRISSLAGVQRLRFTTSHPAHFNNRISDLMASRDNICKFLHLPFQSGSNKILKAMKRGYNIDLYHRQIAYAREKMPRLALSTDVIVGFPGETESDFRETLAVLKDIQFDNVFSFIFSPRPGTTALELDDVTPMEEKKERLSRLLDGQAFIQESLYKRYVGETHDVMIEGAAKHGDGWVKGKTDTWKTVNIPPNLGGKPGDIVRVKITKAFANSLLGDQPASENMPGSSD